MSGSIQYPDFARTFAAAENAQLNRLRLLSARREDEQGRALDAALADPGVAEGLANNDVNVLRRLVTLGRGGREMALPRLDQVRADTEFNETLRGIGLGGAAPAPQAAPAGPAARAPSGMFAPLIAKVAAETGVPPVLLASVMNRESGGNPSAAGDTTLPGGPSIGLMQIRPDTARSPGFGMTGVDPATLADPEANLRFGAQYLKALHAANGGDWTKALQAYNGGQGNVQRGTVSPAAAEYAQAVQGNAGGAPAGRTMDITPQALAALASSRDPRGARLAQMLAPFVRQGDATQVVETADGVMVVNKATGQIIARIGGAPQRGTVVNTTVSGERKGTEQLFTDTAKAFQAAQEAGRAADRNRILYDTAERAIAGFQPGVAADARLWAAQLGSAFGLNTNAPQGELLRSVQRRLELAATPRGQGQITENERVLIRDTVPIWASTPDGARQVLGLLRKLDAYDQNVARIYRENARRNGGTPDPVTVAEELSALGAPLNHGELADLMAMKERGGAGGDTTPLRMEVPDQPDRPVRVRTPEEARRLPRGTRFIDPSGVERVVP